MQGLISNLIRPFRFRYSPFDLGAKVTDKYERQDGNILNDRGFKIQYSYYQNKNSTTTCLVYAHCNSGSRIQGLQFIQPTMDQGWNLCLFDFTGSGISEGQYISLGYYQWMDLQSVISLILKRGNNKVHLWGRSMGAATIILYLSQTKQIDTIISCVLDSPYCSLWRVIKQFGKSKTKIPEFIVEHVMEYLRNSIFKDHRFDIKDLDLVKKIHKIDIPIMFIASTSDSFVNYNHASELYKWAPNKHKVLQYIEKQHNSPRESHTISTGLQFLEKSLNQKQQNKRELRILSKKKQLCRKMTGHNMAELITKPAKISAERKNINSTGNLARFSSFCLNNNQIVVELSPPKGLKGVDKKQNPHKIQQSIIKLTLSAKEMLQQIRGSKKMQNTEGVINSQIFGEEKDFESEHMLRTGKLEKNNSCRVQKQNDQNVSNKSEISEDESMSKGSKGIKKFNSIITKRFNFDQSIYQEYEGKEAGSKKADCKLAKNKTQKINICLRNVAQESPTKKPNGIKLFKRISKKQEKEIKIQSQQHLNKSECRQPQCTTNIVQNRYIKQRVKTEAAHVLRGSSSSSSDEKKPKAQTNLGEVQHFQSYCESEKSKKGPKAWFCGQNPLCKPSFFDDTKEIYLNKYRDSNDILTKEQNRNHEKISFNQNWGSKQRQLQLMPSQSKQKLKHFQSIGESYSTNELLEKKNDLGCGQRIIKIQLDRSLFQLGRKQKGRNQQNENMDGQKGKERKRGSKGEENREMNRLSIQVSQNISEQNPILSKFKIKHRRQPKNQHIESQSRSFL